MMPWWEWIVVYWLGSAFTAGTIKFLEGDEPFRCHCSSGMHPPGTGCHAGQFFSITWPLWWAWKFMTIPYKLASKVPSLESLIEKRERKLAEKRRLAALPPKDSLADEMDLMFK